MIFLKVLGIVVALQVILILLAAFVCFDKQESPD